MTTTNQTSHRCRPIGPWLLGGVLLLRLAVCSAADVELTDGTRLAGALVERTATHLKIRLDDPSSGATTRDIAWADVASITSQGHVLYTRGQADSLNATWDRTPSRSAEEVKAWIRSQGSQPPAWYAETPLEYPRTLDLSRLEAEGEPWNNQKVVGQYIWDIVNPNPAKWRSGVRLLHHMLQIHQDDVKQRTLIMRELGGMYYRFFQDYSRAAFWWQAAGVTATQSNGVALAECYWRLGNRELALEMLRAKTSHVSAVKLLGEMGETDEALALAERLAKRAREPHDVWLAAADACRLANDVTRASQFYQRVLDAPARSNDDYQRRTIERARATLDSLRQYEQADVRYVRDGTYTASSPGYEAQVEVQITVRQGRIEDCRVTQHREKQFYSAIRETPAAILRKQSIQGVDTTSRATMTSEAILNATAKALSRGYRPPEAGRE